MKELILFYSDLRYNKRNVLVDIISKRTGRTSAEVKAAMHSLQPIGYADTDMVAIDLFPSQ